MNRVNDKKVISIDRNLHCFNSINPVLTPFEVEFFGLNEDERIVVYNGCDQWEGIVKFDQSYSLDKGWYIELDLLTHTEVSHGKAEGRKEGELSGASFGIMFARMQIADEMLRDGLEHRTIMKYTKLSAEKIRNISAFIVNER